MDKPKDASELCERPTPWGPEPAMTREGASVPLAELLRRARGIADEFEQVGREQRTQDTLRELADRLEFMGPLMEAESERAHQLGQIVLACIAAGHVKAVVDG